jgi:XTP/dITP diphosphohydrolase
MQSLIFATNNPNKVAEIKNVVGTHFNIITLREAGIDIDIPEPHDTLAANAVEKSSTIHRLTQQNCFSEDTGLEVAALNGQPGVLSARYAGANATSTENIHKLLRELGNNTHRKARFRTVISLILNKQTYFFEGICNGTITTELSGEDGFGYDPIFIPDGSTKTFAQMTMDEKNQYSHRKKATAQLIQFLTETTF